jgi:hypothetical protein
LNYFHIDGIKILAFSDMKELEEIELFSGGATCLNPIDKLNLLQLGNIDLFTN